MSVAKCSFVPSSLWNLDKKPKIFTSNTGFASPHLNISSELVEKASFTPCYSKKHNTDTVENFSVLSSDVPWEQGSTWSTIGFYLFTLHIPLSFGGLSVVAQLMHQPLLDPKTEAISILLIQSIELCGVMALLQYIVKPQGTLISLLQDTQISTERNWVKASAIGFGFLVLIVLLTSLVSDRLVGPKVVNNPILKEIMASGSVSQAACFLTYCFVTPFLEEIVYRRFLLASLASTMKWCPAVILWAFRTVLHGL